MLNVVNATIVRLHEGCDRIALRTELPDGFDNDPLELDFNLPRGTGELYLAEHFPGVPVELITQDKLAAYTFRRD